MCKLIVQVDLAFFNLFKMLCPLVQSVKTALDHSFETVVCLIGYFGKEDMQ